MSKVPRSPLQLTPEQLAKQEERRLKKKLQQEAADAKSKDVLPLLSQAEDERGVVLNRQWISLPGSRNVGGGQTVAVKTWNVRVVYLSDRSWGRVTNW
jgi:hypothetical protein